MLRRPRMLWLGLPLALASGVVMAQAPRRTPARTAAPVAATAAATTAATARSPEDVQRRAQVLARVGDTSLTVGEFEDMLNEAPAPVRQAYVEMGRRREFLENVIQTILLSEEARRRGIDRAPEVSSSIRRILAQRLQQAAVLEAITLESVTDAEVARYYDAHIGDYQIPEQRRATVIYLDDRAAAEPVAEQARAARGDMRRIQQLVREHSVDAESREHDGDLFYFRRTGALASGGSHSVDPAVVAAAFGLARELEVAAPVQTAQGKWAVVVLTGTRPALSRNLRDPGVANSIRGYLVRERRAQREQELLASLRERLAPEVHDDRLELLRLPASDLGNVPAFEPGAPRREPTSGASPVPPPAPSRPLVPAPVH